MGVRPPTADADKLFRVVAVRPVSVLVGKTASKVGLRAAIWVVVSPLKKLAGKPLKLDTGRTATLAASEVITVPDKPDTVVEDTALNWLAVKAATAAVGSWPHCVVLSAAIWLGVKAATEAAVVKVASCALLSAWI